MAYRPTARTEASRQRQHDAVLKAARQLAAAGGFGAVSIQAVAARADVAVGSVYRHFPGKAELCAEVFRLTTQRELDLVAADARQPGSAGARLSAVVEAFCQRAIKGRVQAYALIAEPVDPAVDIERLKYREAYSQIFSQLIREGIDEGLFPAQDTAITAAALVGALAETLVGPLALHLRADTEFDSDETTHFIRQVQAFCLRAVGGTGA